MTTPIPSPPMLLTQPKPAVMMAQSSLFTFDGEFIRYNSKTARHGTAIETGMYITLPKGHSCVIICTCKKCHTVLMFNAENGDDGDNFTGELSLPELRTASLEYGMIIGRVLFYNGSNVSPRIIWKD